MVSKDRKKEYVQHVMKSTSSETQEKAAPLPVPVPQKPTLKKLPMWGGQFSKDPCNFEWPTQDMLDDMEPDVTLRSLTLKSWDTLYGAIGSV